MRTIWLGIVIAVCVALLASPLGAQPVPPPAADDPPSENAEPAAGDGPLSSRQRHVRDRFSELEKLLLRMAELTASTDPHRAALLRRAVAQSKERAIDRQFDELIRLLDEQRLSLAMRGQGDVQRDLARLLDLLLSEDRSERIKSEKERVREYLKRVNQIIKDQKSVQGDTHRGEDADALAERQGELAEDTGQLAEDVQRESAAEGRREESPAEESPSDQSPVEPGEKEPGEKEPGEKEPGDAPAAEKDGKQDDRPAADRDAESEKEAESGDEKSSDARPSGEKSDADSPADKSSPSDDSQPAEGESGEPADQPPMPGEQSEGSSGQSESQPPSDNPAQQRLEQAQRRMREAQEKLEQAQREDAADRQQQALRELEQAKAELEEILRQLREEEMARMLAMLEARFRKMLDVQVQVYEGTKRVAQQPQSDRDRDDQIEAGRLSRMEAGIVVEADKCLALLREEGSAVAFPEAVMEMRDDMQQVVERLARADVGDLTQGIETDIIAALEEMIAALKKAQKDLEDQQQQQGQPGQSPSGEPPLVDVLAELRMIRALQMRVNLRTERYAKLTETEQVDTPELLKALKELGEREQRIHKVTRDIVVGRNR